MKAFPEDIDQVLKSLTRQRYVADRALATAIFLSLKLQKPLLLEGETGVGKTEVAKALASMLERTLIRLQCYEGLDLNTAAYEWNYSRQLIQIRLMESSRTEHSTPNIFGREFLLRRPLLQAIEGVGGSPPVLLIDEVDRADEEFEAFLLEFLSDFQMSIPEIGTIKAESPPVVVVTSNRTREIHDALKRRCLYHWIDYPSFEKEYEIILSKVPGAPESLASQVVAFAQALRRQDLYKRPGVSEVLDWMAALAALNRQALDEETVTETLGVLLKYRDDIEQVKGQGIRGILAGLGKAPGF